MCHTTLHFQMDIREYDNHAENDKYIKSFIRVRLGWKYLSRRSPFGIMRLAKTANDDPKGQIFLSYPHRNSEPKGRIFLSHPHTKGDPKGWIFLSNPHQNGDPKGWIFFYSILTQKVTSRNGFFLSHPHKNSDLKGSIFPILTQTVTPRDGFFFPIFTQTVTPRDGFFIRKLATRYFSVFSLGDWFESPFVGNTE